jgi:hypothetical protein
MDTLHLRYEFVPWPCLPKARGRGMVQGSELLIVVRLVERSNLPFGDFSIIDTRARTCGGEKRQQGENIQPAHMIHPRGREAILGFSLVNFDVRFPPIADISVSATLWHMRRGNILATVLVLVAAASVAAYMFVHQSEPSSQLSIIRGAQTNSYWRAEPKWLEFTDPPALFAGVRDRGYAYCLSNGQIDPGCAQDQDDAVHSAVLAILTVHLQRAMPDKSTLERSEYWVATNPDVAAGVVRDCWALYREHSASDARILSVCLGNLVRGTLLDEPVP